MDAKANAWGVVEIHIVEKLACTVYVVQGDSGKDYMIKVLDTGEEFCTCRGHMFHGKCKHIERLHRFLTS